jgi:chaperonin GroES
MKLRLLHDWVLARVEPAPAVSPGGIVLVAVQPIRNATVLAVGPGKRNSKGVLTPTQLRVGDTFPFFKAAAETKQGYQLALLLEDNEVLIRESDVLFVLEEPLRVEY